MNIDEISEAATQAKTFLDDPLFQETVKTLTHRIRRQWEQAQTLEKREQEWFKLQGLKAILLELRLPLDQAQAMEAKMEEAKMEEDSQYTG